MTTFKLVLDIGDQVTLLETLPDNDPPLLKGDVGNVTKVINDGEAYEVELCQYSIYKVYKILKPEQIEIGYISLKDLLKKDLGLPESSFSGHESDLYVLNDRPEIGQWLKKNYRWYKNVVHSHSNVKGQDWYGKNFYDIPFARMRTSSSVIATGAI